DRQQRRRALALEPLEDRSLLSVTLEGVPDWIEQGPGPITVGGQVGEQVGAINDVAVNPSDSNIVFVATANGGVWRSLTATYSTSDGVDNDGDTVVVEADERPTWEPLTDQQQILSMSTVA